MGRPLRLHSRVTQEDVTSFAKTQSENAIPSHGHEDARVPSETSDELVSVARYVVASQVMANSRSSVRPERVFKRPGSRWSYPQSRVCDRVRLPLAQARKTG